MRLNDSVPILVVAAATILSGCISTSAFLLPAGSLSQQRPQCFRTLRSDMVRSQVQKFSMIYTSPRIDDEQDEATLDALKLQLDRAVQMSSGTKLPQQRRSAVPRSPCTSLYGNWRPTTGTEPYRKATRVAKAAARPVQPAPKPKRGVRGRPPGIPRAAVRDAMLPEFVARATHVLELNGGSMDSNLFGQQWKLIHCNTPLYSFKSTKAVTIHQMLRENNKFFDVSETDRQKVKMFTLKGEQANEYLKECRESGLLDGVTNDAKEMVSKSEGVAIQSRRNQDDVEAMSFSNPPALKENMELSPLPSVEQLDAPLSPLKEPEADESVFHAVPGQGRARMASYDRRVLLGKKSQRKQRETAEEEVLPVAPFRHPDDALARPVISLYNSWAVDGRDVVMEVTHRAAFDEMWAFVLEEQEAQGDETFTVVDAACGNGWAARVMADHEQCAAVTAVDGAALMIEKARDAHDREMQLVEEPEEDEDEEPVPKAPVEYVVGDVETWYPKDPVDVVVMTEALYLLEDPQDSVEHVVNAWLKPGGRVVASLDCYWENKLSHAWEEDLGVEMHCLEEEDWTGIFTQAGLSDVKFWRSKAAGPWQGPLIVTGTKA